MNKAVFLDRDGTINIEKNYLYEIDKFEFIEGVPEAIKILNDKGYLVIVVTNQAGIGRGYYTEEDMHKLHKHIDKELEKYNAHIDAYYFCPHHPEHGIGKYRVDCECRKPRDGMLRKALEDYNINAHNSYVIGDKVGDAYSGAGLGIKGIIVESGHKLIEKDRTKFQVKRTLLEAVREDIIKQRELKNVGH